ncbi:hypothetical protein ZWY2020_043560 [Hordeum vulgare]|nr:hypothetical protein ZWY2020_043560 [Hordeum vulgare]
MDERVSLMMMQPDDSARAAVLALPSPLALAGDKEEEEELFESDDESYYEEDSDDEVDVPLKIDAVVATGASGVTGGPPLHRWLYVPEGRFLGPAPRFASAGNTAGFLGVAVVVPPPADLPAAKDETALSPVRRPPAGDAAGSLQWAGASLAPLIYPSHHSSELQALWSKLVSNVAVCIPPGTTRLKVIADVGILRLEDYTPGRMDVVMDALQGMIADPWPGYHVAMELSLPEPVHAQCAAEAEAADGDCGRPAKRRKVVAEEVAGQECSVCFELLESDLAVWPGCSLPHVFHGACLADTLKGSEMCPLCRRKLSAPDDKV